MITLALLGGGIASKVYLDRVTPQYTSTARIYVEQKLPALLSANSGPVEGFGAKYLHTQSELIRSTPVLSIIAEDRELRSLPSLQGKEALVPFLRERSNVIVGKQDDIVNISVTLEEPTDSERITNAIVDTYVEHYAEDRRSDIVEVLTILKNEKRRRDDELEQRRKDLADYRAEHVAFATQMEDDSVVVQMAASLSTELNQAKIALLEARARLSRASRLKKIPEQEQTLYQLATSGGASRGRESIDIQFGQVSQQLLEERSRWGDGHPNIQLLLRTLEGLEAERSQHERTVIDSYLQSLEQSVLVLTEKRDKLQKAYDEQFAIASEAVAHIAQVETLEDAYTRTARMCDILDERIKEVNLGEEVGAMNVSIVETASSGAMTFPNHSKTQMMGIVFGAMIGIGLAWVQNVLDPKLRSLSEVESILNLPTVGALSRVSFSGRSPQDVARMLEHWPASTEAESVRSLRTTLQIESTNSQSQVFAVTSPSSGEGKTTVACNLAIAMAQAGQRVLLVDADMRRSNLAVVFDTVLKVGLAEVLSGEVDPVEAIAGTDVRSLDLMSAGGRQANPVDLLDGALFKETLETLKLNYDRIIIDSPPVLPVADARLIASNADCTLLVVRQGLSDRSASRKARDELIRARAKRIGLVVNSANPSARGYKARV